MMNVVLPIMLVTALSGIVMWLPTDGGASARVGFSVTLILTMMSMVTFTSGLRPASKEETWLDRYIAWNVLLTSVPLIETCLIVGLRQELYAWAEDISGKRVERHANVTEVVDGIT